MVKRVPCDISRYEFETGILERRESNDVVLPFTDAVSAKDSLLLLYL